MYEAHIKRELEARSAGAVKGNRKYKWSSGEHQFFVQSPSPKEWKYSIDWVYPEDLNTWQVFQNLFNKILVKDFIKNNDLGFEIDFKDDISMFAGSLVVRVGANNDPYWHVDYEWSDRIQAKQAYTLMTPLYDMSSYVDGHLLYKNHADEECVYTYKLGRAIIFGSGFEHATQPCSDGQIKAFLCFNFGSDKFDKYYAALAPPVGPPIGSPEFTRLVHDQVFKLPPAKA